MKVTQIQKDLLHYCWVTPHLCCPEKKDPEKIISLVSQGCPKAESMTICSESAYFWQDTSCWYPRWKGKDLQWPILGVEPMARSYLGQFRWQALVHIVLTDSGEGVIVLLSSTSQGRSLTSMWAGLYLCDHVHSWINGWTQKLSW